MHIGDSDGDHGSASRDGRGAAGPWAARRGCCRCRRRGSRGGRLRTRSAWPWCDARRVGRRSRWRSAIRPGGDARQDWDSVGLARMWRTRSRVNGCPVPVRSHRPFRVSAIWRSVCSVASARTISTMAAGVRRRSGAPPWDRAFEGRRRPTLPANVQLDRAAAEQRDVLDQEPQHPLALARRGPRIVPHAREIGDQAPESARGRRR